MHLQGSPTPDHGRTSGKPVMADGIGLDAWWDQPAYKTCNTFHLRGRSSTSSKQHDPARFAEVVAELCRDDVPDPQGIGKFEWQTIPTEKNKWAISLGPYLAREGAGWCSSVPHGAE